MNSDNKIIQALRQTGKEIRSTADGVWQCQCPAHDDRQASLTVTVRGGKTLLYCHAGCLTDAVVEALGLNMTCLFTNNKRGIKTSSTKNAKREKVVETYDYVDADGTIVFQVVRYDPKSFRQRRPDGRNGWIWNLKEIDMLLYRLPEVLAAETVFIVEGERDVESLRKIGLTATTNAGGAGKWRQEYSECLRDRDVILLPDNDEAGTKHGNEIARQLVGIAKSIKIIDLPGLPIKGDVTDWLQSGNTIEELHRMVFDTPIIKEPPQKMANPFVSERWTGRDIVGLLVRLGMAKGNPIVRYRGDYYRWNDKSYKIVPKELIIREIYQLIDQLKIVKPKGNIEPVISSRRLADDALHALVSVDDVAILPNELDAPFNIHDPINADMLALNNGVLDLNSLTFKQHESSVFVTGCTAYDYDPEAQCPYWIDFLNSVFPGDDESIRQLQKYMGYILTKRTDHHKILLLIGARRSGKGTIVRLLEQLIGTDNFGVMEMGTVHTQFALQDIIGKRIVAIPDARIKDITQNKGTVERILTISGGDTLRVDRKYRDPINVKSTAKILIATNVIPNIYDSSRAFAGRLLPLVFSESFFGREDAGLDNRLYGELAGILNWAIQGFERLNRDGRFTVPSTSLDMVEQIDRATSPISAFVDDCCIVITGAEVTKTHLYQRYIDWCYANGYRNPKTTDQFIKELVSAYPEIKTQRRGRGPDRCRIYTGIGIAEGATL